MSLAFALAMILNVMGFVCLSTRNAPMALLMFAGAISLVVIMLAGG